MTSSFSRQTISADFKLSPYQRILWLFRNFSHLFLSFFNSSPEPPYSYTTSQNIYGSVPEYLRSNLVSPSRALCSLSLVNLFYRSFLDNINAGKTSFTLLDYGCGNSNMISMIEQALLLIDEKDRSNFVINYHGFDPYLPDRSYEPHLNNILITRTSDNISTFGDTFDLIVSFSVLEHVYDDINQLNDLSLISSKQVHYVPAACSLFAYLWHGYRVYDKFNLTNLLHKLSLKSHITVSPIGNLLSSLIYIFYTSLPDGIFIILSC